MEELETGVFLESLGPELETGWEDEDDSGLLFGDPERLQEPLFRELSGAALPAACGTAETDIAAQLEGCGTVEALAGASLSDVTEALAQDARVLCRLRQPGPTEAAPFLPEHESFRLAELRGIDLRDPDAARVCLAAPDGSAPPTLCPLGEFLDAWLSGGSRCHIVYRE